MICLFSFRSEGSTRSNSPSVGGRFYNILICVSFYEYYVLLMHSQLEVKYAMIYVKQKDFGAQSVVS